MSSNRAKEVEIFPERTVSPIKLLVFSHFDQCEEYKKIFVPL